MAEASCESGVLLFFVVPQRKGERKPSGHLLSACGVFSLPAPENFALQNSPQRK
jgi:hypothetical protein